MLFVHQCKIFALLFLWVLCRGNLNISTNRRNYLVVVVFLLSLKLELEHRNYTMKGYVITRKLAYLQHLQNYKQLYISMSH